MSVSAHQHRILLLVPVSKVTAVVAWLQANVDATCPANLGPPLNPSGLDTDPVTHRWQSASWQDADCRKLLFKMCQLASVTPPTLAQWNGWTGAEKRSWLVGVRNTILANYGVLVWLADNTGVWDSPDAALAAMGLKAIGGT